jgi:L-lactate dehydrogenase complex protein LldE
MDHLFPDKGEKLVLLLKHLGYEVEVPPKQPCCGQIAYNNGYVEEAKTQAQHWLRFFKNKQPIVVGGASCTHMIKHVYPELFTQDKHLFPIVYDFLSFLALHPLQAFFAPTYQDVIAVHQSCTGLRKLYKGKNLTFDILSSFPQLKVISTSVDRQCCGFGGTFLIKYPELSSDMGLTKLQGAIDAKAKLLVTSDVSCFLQLNSLLQKHNLPIQLTTIIDFLFDYRK